MKSFKKSFYKHIFLYVSSIILMTCSGSDGGSSPTEPTEPTYIVNLVSLGGAAQKGPFNNGTIINIAELNNSLTPTGKNFTSQIIDNSGTFSVANVQMEFSYAQINASGFYFDEVGNKVSSAQLVLTGLSNLAGKTSMNVNVLSHLEMNRIRNLTSGDNPLTFSQAKVQAQEEVLAIFGFTRSGMAESELLDITQSGSGNAKLLAISAVLQSDRSVGELSELLANISTDITSDGVLNDANIIENLRQSAYGLNLSEIRTNLESRYASLGLSVTIPDFETEVNNFYKPPVANDMNISTDEDTAINITLDASDPEGESLTFTTVEVNNATVTINGNTATYSPDANFNGTDTFTYLANDGSFNSNTATVTIEVGAVDDEPNTNDINTSTDEDVSVVMSLTADEYDGQSYSFNIVSNPSNGSVNLNGSQATYTPIQDWNGTDTFTFEATDDRTSRTNVATATIVVNPVNDAPVANDVTVQMDENKEFNLFMPATITLDATDIEGDNLAYSVVSDPTNGTLGSVDGVQIIYTPNQDFNGQDTFTYKANDGTVDSNIATVTITIDAVNDTPVTTDQAASTDEDTAVNITLTSSDVEGDAVTYSVVNNSSNGTTSLSGDVVTYTPSVNFNGTDTFTFKANDGTADGNTSTVTITVNAVNDAPVANDVTTETDENLYNSTQNNTNVNVTYDQENDILIVNDPKGDTILSNTSSLDITLDGTDVDGDNLTYLIVSTNNGTVAVNGSSATYEPTQDWNGTDTFTYKANDGVLDSNIATVTITVNSVNDAPTSADEGITTNEDTSVRTGFSSSDVDGDALTYIIVSQPSNGTVTIDNSNNEPGLYTPNLNFNGTDTFTYKANDGELDSNIATATVTVTAVNDAPTTDDVATTIDENRTASRSTGITLQGSDVDGDDLTYSIVSSPSNGTASISGSTLTYEANQDYNGTETITYKANDGTVDSNTSTITITITPVNDTPVVTGGGTGQVDTQAIKFSGTGSYLEVPSNGTGSELEFSAAAWIKVTSQPNQPSGGTIIARRNYDGSERTHFHFWVGNNMNLTFMTNDRNQNTFQISTADNSITLNQWHYVAYTFDNGTSTFYIDGVPASHSNSGSVSGNTNQLYSYDHWINIGAVHRTGGTSTFDFFTGEMNELTIWDDPLTQTDITTLYNDGKYYAADDLGKDLNGWWQFESSFLVDSSGTWGDASLIVGGGSITTIDTNLSPSTTSASITTDEDTAATIDLSSFASDVDGDVLTYSIVTDVDTTNGTTALSGSTVTYTPAANYNGTDSFTWKVNDGTVDSATGTVNITVTAVNDAPTTDDIATTIDENRTASRSTGITLQGSDIEGDDLTYSIVSSPSNGTASISGATLTYEANQDYNGTETITYKANDGSLDSNTSTITITITPVNDTPVVTGTGNLSMKFDASLVESGNTDDGYVQFPANTFDFGGEWTMSFWYKDGGVTTGTQRIFSRGYTESDPHEGSSGNAAIGIGFLNGGSFARNLEFHARETSGEAAYSNSTINDSDGWQHYVIVRNNNSMDLYINSSLDGFYNPIGNIVNNDYQSTDFINRIGSGALTLDDNGLITGWIDDFAIWDNSLNTSQISSLYNGGNGGVDPSTVLDEVVLYYSFDGETISGTTISDQSGNGHDATFTNVQGALTTSSDVPFGTGGTAGDSVTITTDEDTETTIDLSTYASDVDGDDLTYTIVTDVTNGTLTDPSAGSTVTYIPTANYNGTDSFTWKVNDGTVDSATGTVNITVTAVNDAPTTDDIATTIDENRVASRSTGITLQGSDIDGDDLTYSIVSAPSNGTASISGATLTYEANQDYNGTETITYKANDGTVDSNTSTITITITPVNDTPVVTGEDDDITYWNFTPTSTGDLVTISSGYDMTSNNSKMTISYDYALNQELPENTDIFMWGQTEGELNMRMGRGPSTNTAETTGNNSYYIQVSIKDGSWTYLTSLIDYDTDKHNVTGVFDRENGELKLYYDYALVASTSYTTGSIASGNWYNDRLVWAYSSNWGSLDFNIYKANIWHGTALTQSQIEGNGAGVDQIVTPSSQYNFDDADGSATINDSIGSKDGAVVSGTGGGEGTYTNTVTLNEDVATDIDLSSYVSDVDGDNLTYSIVTDVTNGTTSISGSTVTYTPTANYNGSDSFTFKSNDGTVDSATSGVSITVTAVNDAPTTENVESTMNETRTINLSSITLDGSDVDGDDLTYSVVSGPSNGTATISGSTLTYTVNQDWNGTETITYKANDGSLDSNTSTVTITVQPVNDTPIVNSGSSLSLDGTTGYAEISAQENSIDLSSSNFTLSAWIVLDGEDSNTNAATIMSTGTGSTNNGLYFMVEGGELELSFYGNNFLETSDLGFEGDNTWHHVAATFEADSNTAKLYVDGTLEATDTFNSAFSGQGTNFTLGTTAWNYVDKFEGFIDEAAVWNSALSASQIATLANDSKNPLEIDSSNLSAYWEFESNSGNSDIITDLSSNSNHLTNNATLASNGTSLSVATLEDTDVNIQLYVNDVDGDELTYSITSDASNGTTSLSGNIVTYSPDANYNGSDSFTYVANDGATDSATGTVNITVTAVNDAPTSSDETINLTYESDNTYSITLPAGSDIEGDDITYITVSTDDLHGSFSHDGSSQTGTFTSNSKLTGDGGTLTFKVNDGTSDSNISTVTLIVDSGDVTTNNTNNQSLDFSGNDTYVTLPEINLGLGAPNSAMSISFWVKNANDGGVMIQSNSGWISGNASQSVDFGRINTWNGEFAFGLRDKPNGIEIEPSATASVTLTDWNHIVYVFGSGENKMYINGVESAFDRASSYTSSHNFYNSNRVWEIGRHRDSSDDTTFNNFTGLLDDLAIWDIELTSSQVTSLYNNGDMLTANNVSPDDLKAYYNMEGSGSTIVDQSGNYKDGTITNASFSTQTIVEELSMKFDASLVESGNTDDGYVQFPANTFDFGGEWTMSFWYKDGGVTSGTQRIFSRGYTETDPHEGSAGNAAIGIGFLNGGNQARNLEFHARETSGEAAYSNSTITDNDGWQHYVIVRNNNSMDLYINSSLDGFYNPIGNIVDNDYESTDFINRIGSGALTLDDNGLITGWIDDFVIWDNSLNTSQISSLYNGGNGGVDPSTVLNEVVVYYNFNASTISGTTISDQSGNGHDATFTNVQGALTTSTDVP